jgi:hypothetical protein
MRQSAAGLDAKIRAEDEVVNTVAMIKKVETGITLKIDIAN